MKHLEGKWKIMKTQKKIVIHKSIMHNISKNKN